MNNFNGLSNSVSFRDYLVNTFMAMALGVSVSMFVAIGFANVADYTFAYSPIVTIATIAELVVAMVFSFGLMKMSKTTAWICFIAYSALTGFSLSSIFYVYSYSSIAVAFVSTLILFMCMAFIGKTTNVDLSRFSGILLSGLVAIIITTIINIFILKSTGVELVLSYAGIVIFLGLIAYDMQRLQYFYNETLYDEQTAEKMMIYGAFQLYLDFINLFLRVLRFFGRSKSRD